MSRFTFIRQTLASASFALAALSVAQSPVTVTEYYNLSLDAFFITGRANEQALLDVTSGFRRTGMNFSAVAADGASTALSKICRYYISTVSPFVSSHFYGVQDTDCVQIAALSPAGFSYEGFDFATTLPGANRTCPVSAPIPIRRAYRPAAGGKTGNHRYAASQGTIDGMVALGWTDEGTTFCASTATTITKSDSQKNFEALLLNGGIYRLRFGSTATGSKVGKITPGLTLSAEVISSQSLGNLPSTGQTIFSTIQQVAKTVPTGSDPPRTEILTTEIGQTPVIPSAYPPIVNLRYTGDQVETRMMSDGASQVAYTVILSKIQTFPLAGPFGGTPMIVSSRLPFLTSPGSVNQTTLWPPDAAYMTATVTPLIDIHVIANCVPSVTTWTIPCPNSMNKTFEQFFPYTEDSGKTWNITDGTISLYANGDRGFVAKNSGNMAQGYQNWFLSSWNYRSFYQSADRSGIYAGVTFPAKQPVWFFGSGTNEPALFLNKAATDAIGAAIDSHVP